MALSVKDDEADRLARRLARLTGESLTQAVRTALAERLEREAAARGPAGRADRLLAIGRRCADHMGGPARSLDHGALLYDENGLPK